MATGQLGKAARVSYESKNRVSGLNDIEVTIQRPDGIDLGPFSMVEYKPGFYLYDFITTLSDLEGDYLGFISSPSEGHSAHFKLSLFKAVSGGSGGEIQITGCEPLIGKISPMRLFGVAKKVVPLLGKIKSVNLVSKTEPWEPLKGKVNNVALKGLTNKDC